MCTPYLSSTKDLHPSVRLAPATFGMHIVTLSHLMLQAAHIAPARRQLNRAALAVHHLRDRRFGLQHGVSYMHLAIGADGICGAQGWKVLIIILAGADMENIGELALHLGDRV